MRPDSLNRADRLALGVVLAPVLEDHPDRSLAGLLGIPACSCHDSILPRNGASGNPRAVQSCENERISVDLHSMGGKSCNNSIL